MLFLLLILKLMKKAFLFTLPFLLFHSISWSQSGITVFPHEEDFEGTNNCPVFCGSPCNLTSSWRNVGGDDIDWTADNGGTGSGGTGPSQDFNPGSSSGIYVYTEASGCVNDAAFLVSPRYNFTQIRSLVLEFAYHQFGNQMGNLHVDAQVANGSWINNISPPRSQNNNSWQKWTIPVPQFEGEDSVRFRIRGVTGTGLQSDMAVDDIFVGSIFDNDIAITNVLEPVQDCNFNGTYDVRLRLRNLGLLDQSNFDLAYQINDRTPVIESFSGNFLSDQTITYTFNQQAAFIGDSNFVFSTWIVFPADSNKINDSVMNIGLKTVMPIQPVDFEAWDFGTVDRSIPGWNEGIGNGPSINDSDWQRSDSLQSIHFGVATAKVNIKGFGINDWLLTPSFKVTQPSRVFYFTAVTTPGGTVASNMGSDDFVKTRISVDCGQTWSDVHTYNTGNTPGNTLAQQFIVLDSYVGQEIIVGFQANSGNNSPEDYDFHIALPQARFVYPNDVGISNFWVGMTVGNQTMQAGTGDIVNYTIKNFGSNQVEDIPVLAEVGNSVYQHIQYQGISSNAEENVQAGGYWAYSNGPSQVPVRIYTLLPNDTINRNDTLTGFITVLGVTNLVEDKLEETKVYPNPNSGAFSVTFNRESNFEDVKVIDASGKLILKQKLESGISGISLDLREASIAPGSYSLILSGSTTKTLGFVID